MRLKLYISGDLVETYPDQALLLTREIYTRDNILSTDIGYSQQLAIPATERNQRIFDYAHLLDHWEKPSPHVPLEGVASLEDGNDLRVIVELRGFTYERGVIKDYQIAFYIHAPELFAHFANDNLADVDFSELDFILNQENVMATWEADAGDIYCPIIAHSKTFYWLNAAPTNPVPGDIAHDGTGVELTDCKPGYKLTRLLEIIFEKYGQSLTWGTKPAAHLVEAFVLPCKTAGALTLEIMSTDYHFEGLQRTDKDYTGDWQLIEIDDIISNNNNNWYDQKYHAPANGEYWFEIHFNQDIIDTITIGYSINGGGKTDTTFFKKLGAAHFQIGLTAGDYVEFFFRAAPDLLNKLIGAGVKTYKFEGDIYNNQVVASAQFPEMRVAEFVKAFLGAFKLTLLQVGDREYKVYDTRSIYNDGTTRDWSKYIDAKVLPYQKRDAFRRLVLSHTEGEDNYNSVFRSLAGRNFGSVNYDTGLVFGDNEITMTSPFTIFPPVFLGSQDEDGNAATNPTDLLLHQQVNAEGEPVMTKFILLYRNGTDGTDYPYYLQDGTDGNGATFSQVNTWGYYSAFQQLPAEITTPCLTYGMENPPAGVVPQACLAYEFWRDILEVFINNSAFQLPNMTFRVPASEMSAFRINDTILVNGIYHIPVKAVYDYINDVIKLDLLIYHPAITPTLPVIASASGEFTNPLDIPSEIMHTLGGRRRGDRIFRINAGQIWKAKKLI